MQRVLVLGSTGMLGRQVAKYLSNKHEIFEGNRQGISMVPNSKSMAFDAANEESISSLFEIENFDYVINCVGLIKQKFDKSLESKVEAIYVNALFPHLLNREAMKHDSKVIQICTDCVFSGANNFSTESTPHDAIDVYGTSKSLGELSSPSWLELRCSIVGRENIGASSLLEWFLAQPSGVSIKGFVNHHWNGLTTLHFAKIVDGIILSNQFIPGTFHIIPSDYLSKFELLELFAEIYSKTDNRIERFESENTIDRTLGTNFPEINSQLWRQAGYLKPPSIREMISELKSHDERSAIDV